MKRSCSSAFIPAKISRISSFMNKANVAHHVRQMLTHPKMKQLLCLLVAIILTGCATKLPTDQASSLDYGTLPDNYKDLMLGHFNRTLKDPMSAKIEFDTPVKGYVMKAPIAGGGIDKAGWIVPVRINAKNSYGGYVGEQLQLYLFSKGEAYPIYGRAHLADEK